MPAGRTYEQIIRDYEEARMAFEKGFREYLLDRGTTITSPDHLSAERSNYALAHHADACELEALGVEYTTARAAHESRALEAMELAARAQDTSAQWARMSNDLLVAKGSTE